MLHSVAGTPAACTRHSLRWHLAHAPPLFQTIQRQQGPTPPVRPASARAWSCSVQWFEMAAPPPDSSPLVYELAHFPVVCATFILCVARYTWLNRSVADRVADSAFSFKAIVSDGEIDRIIFAQMSHESFLHLALNMSSLISLRDLESSLGCAAYLRLVLVLMFLSAALMLALSLALYKRTAQLVHLTSSSIGYSCVLFAMTSFQASSRASAAVSIFGIRMPALFAPFASLVMVSVLVPSSSFLGHLSGIVSGFVAAALSLHTVLPLSFLATLPLLCLVSKYARSQRRPIEEARREAWDSV